MTALNFAIDTQQVFIAMDTLATTTSKEPAFYTTKFFLLPHLDGVICGTGHQKFVQDWFVRVNTSMLVKDMVHLNEFTPPALREMWQCVSYTNQGTVTVYHFGYCEVLKSYKAFAYRSERDFVSEELPNGIGIKPAYKFDIPQNMQLPDVFIDWVKEQRMREDAKSANDKVGIGGDIYFLHLTPGQINVSRCYRFPDYESMYTEMCKKLPG